MYPLAEMLGLRVGQVNEGLDVWPRPEQLRSSTGMSCVRSAPPTSNERSFITGVGDLNFMTRDDLAKAGLKLCDEIEGLMSDGEINDQALLPAAQLRRLMDKLAQLDPDPPESRQAYESMTDMLLGFLYNRDLAQAIRGLWFVRLALAEELTDKTLFDSLMKSPPTVGAA
jgi:hypothetical protein